MTRIFLTGSTGYIGGDALSVFVEAHPEWEITCLVRSREKAKLLANRYPPLKTVLGDLESTHLIEQQAAAADIVYHFADCDDENSAAAIARGLARHRPDSPGYWIHVSGTGILTYPDFDNLTFGQASNVFFDDWDNVEKLHSLPDHARHRLVDKIVLQAGTDHYDRVRTAIVCPPTIYGLGRGPGNTRSAQAYNLTREILARRQGLIIGKGENVWTQVHVFDLSMLFLLLGEAATAGEGGKASWGETGYYFAENGEFVWGDIARAITRYAHERQLLPSPDMKSLDFTKDAEQNALAPSADVPSLTAEEASAISDFFHYPTGSNARCKAIRARRLLGWSPKERLLIDEVPTIVDSEAAALGLW